jgi:transposase InsO family protein
MAGAPPWAVEHRRTGGYGHTAMVRDRQVRASAPHLPGSSPPTGRCYGAGWTRATVLGPSGMPGEPTTASIRVYRHQAPDGPAVMVTVRRRGRWPPTSGAADGALSALVAHIKHIGDFGRGYYQRLARDNGFDGHC